MIIIRFDFALVELHWSRVSTAFKSQKCLYFWQQGRCGNHLTRKGRPLLMNGSGWHTGNQSTHYMAYRMKQDYSVQPHLKATHVIANYTCNILVSDLHMLFRASNEMITQTCNHTGSQKMIKSRWVVISQKRIINRLFRSQK